MKSAAPDRPLLDTGKTSNRILSELTWRSLERIQDALAWDDSFLAGKLGIPDEHFSEKKKLREDIPASSILSLSSFLGIDPETLAYGRFDRESLRVIAEKTEAYNLPERYSQGAFSRRRTSLHLLKFCDAHFGSRATFSLLKQLQIRREIFDLPDEYINIRFLTDSCDILKKMGLPDEYFPSIGRQSAAVNQNSALANELRKTKNVQDAFDLQINHLVHFYDRNCRYWITQLSPRSCSFRCVPRPEAQEALKEQLVGSKLTCLTRVGVVSAITTLLGLPFAPVKKFSCIHEGDSSCGYLVDLEPAQRLKDRNLRLIRSSTAGLA